MTSQHVRQALDLAQAIPPDELELLTNLLLRPTPGEWNPPDLSPEARAYVAFFAHNWDDLTPLKEDS